MVRSHRPSVCRQTNGSARATIWAGKESSTMHTVKPSGGFGDVLRRYRTDRGLAQEELAERAGLSARGVQDLESGLRLAPQAITIRRLADALGLEDFERVRLLGAVDRTRSP